MQPVPSLQAAVQRATANPERLAYYLDAYGLDDLCARLRCPPEAALRLHLFATPDAYEWLRSISLIAQMLDLPFDRLTLLLHEAIRCQGGRTLTPPAEQV